MVSIVLPCFNHGKYVEDAIYSVLNQTYTDFELFVFDNGSTDDSWEIIKEIEDPRMIKIKLEKNDLLKVKKCFIDMASGNYFAIMHSDDIWRKEKLEKQMDFLKENKHARLCFTWSEYVDELLNPIDGYEDYFKESNKSIAEWWDTFFSRFNHLSFPSFLCEKEIYIKYFGRLYPYRQIADFYCWMKILEETNIYIVEETLVDQRAHHFGDNKNESSRTYENVCREIPELRYAFYDIIDKMSDKTFTRYFCMYKDEEIPKEHIDVMCNKFMFFLSRSNRFIYESDNVIRYYNTYFDYEENGHVFYQYLYEKYNFSRNDFFQYEVTEGYTINRIQSRVSRWAKLENTDFSTIKFPDSISIYGCGQIGKTFCKKIMSYCYIEQFIDAIPKIDSYMGIPVVTLEQAKINENSVIIVIPSYDMDNIVKGIKDICGNLSEEQIISFDEFVKMGRIIDEKF